MADLLLPHNSALLHLDCPTCEKPFTRFRSQAKSKTLYCSVACRYAHGRATVCCMWPGCKTQVPCRSYERNMRGRLVRVYKLRFIQRADYRKSVLCPHHEERAAVYLGRDGDFRLTNGRHKLLSDPDYEFDARGVSGKLIRGVLFERANMRCEACGLGLVWDAPPKTWEVDHRIPVFRGGRSKLSNLNVLCAACHKAKTSIEKTEVTKARWNGRTRGTRFMTHYEKDRLIDDLRGKLKELQNAKDLRFN